MDEFGVGSRVRLRAAQWTDFGHFPAGSEGVVTERAYGGSLDPSVVVMDDEFPDLRDFGNALHVGEVDDDEMAFTWDDFELIQDERQGVLFDA